MDTCKSGSEIADHIRLKVIYEGLELEEIGIDLAEITDDVRLFDEDGLNLDSIDALEILAGVQREFGLSLSNVDQAFMDEHCVTVGRLASMVADRSPDCIIRGRTRSAGERVRTPNAPEPRVESVEGPASDVTAETLRADSLVDS